MNTISKTKSIEWIKIGIQISNHPLSKVFCPNCKDSKMDVYDLFPDDINIKKFERVIKCPLCLSLIHI